MHFPMGGAMTSKVPFQKPPTTPAEQVRLLKSRGLSVSDDRFAAEFLSQINYYRFCGYALHFEHFQNRERTHRYKAGSRFEDVVSLYEFDSELRTLLFSYVEPIEVLFRTAVCSELCLRHRDSHWHLNRALFDESVFEFDRFLDDCKKEYSRSREIFVQAYRAKYSTPELPAAWMMTEILSIGKWSKIFGGLKYNEDKKAIARCMNATPWHLQSWMHSLSYVRNLCAHHSRIWNRTFQIRVNLTKRQKQSILNPARLAAHCTVMADILAGLGKRQGFKQQLVDLFARYPVVPIEKMGFKPDWHRGEIWQ